MAKRTISTEREFVEVHGILLAAAGIPPPLYGQLFRKLHGESFDGGSFFHVELCSSGRQRMLVLSPSHPVLPKESQVFLIDHAVSFRLENARSQMEGHPTLVERLAEMMCVVDEKNDVDSLESEDNDAVASIPKERGSLEDRIRREQQKCMENDSHLPWLELDELDIDDNDLICLELPTKLPNLVGLSLWGNKIKSIECILQTISGLQNLRALWLNENPIAQHRDLEKAILQIMPELEIYNSKFTDSYSHWAVGRCIISDEDETGNGDPFYRAKLKDAKALDISDRNIHILKRQIFNPMEMPLLSHLNLCGNPFDGHTRADFIEVLKSFLNLDSLEVDIPGPLGSSSLDIIESLPQLSLLNGVKVAKILEERDTCVGNLKPRCPKWHPDEPLIDRVMREMWKYIMTYRLANEDTFDETSVWYMMDELGCALRHSDDPNFRVAPFMFMPDGTIESAISYSLIWPIKNVYQGEECTRDYLFGIGEDKQRSFRLTAWFYTPINYFEQVYKQHRKQLENCTLKFPDFDDLPTQTILPAAGHALKVYTDIPHVVENLKRQEFILCDEASEADILWTGTQVDEDLKKAMGLPDHQYINQFPFEACIVMKHHLAQTMQQAYGSPSWLQPTYNMESQLAELIGDYCIREKEGKNNLWIVKPWNMARSIDMAITGQLPALIRLMETGPKICQKYIDNCTLFRGKKFDMRYVVLVRSLRPFEVFMYDVFWARLSNNPYTLDERSLSDYDTHFTVMNYGRKMSHIDMHDFVPEFETEHKVKWADIHTKIRHMISSVFKGAYAVHPEIHSSTSRAMYGVDIMLDDSFQPKLLEVTYCPDCTRACKYDVNSVLDAGERIMARDFFNDAFGCLFLNEERHFKPVA